MTIIEGKYKTETEYQAGARNGYGAYRAVVTNTETGARAEAMSAELKTACDKAMQKLKQQEAAPERQQLDMFASTGRVDDLPLFSGTPQRVEASHFDPKPIDPHKQTKLF